MHWLLLLSAAWAGPEVDYSGRVQYDLRFKLDGEDDVGTWYNPVEQLPTVARNQLQFKNRVVVTADRFSGVLDADLVLIGYPGTAGGPYPGQLNSIGDLSERSLIDTFRIETHEAYFDAKDLLPGLDLRLGQQRALFGVGDQFNPTNVFNPDDVEDVLLFGDQQGQIMARMDYYAPGNLQLTGLMIPVFRPALLPASGRFQPLNVNRLPFYEDELRWRVHAEKNSAEDVFDTPTIVGNVTPDLPRADIENIQFGFRLGAWVLGQDIALSYFRGFDDIPTATSTHTTQTQYDEPICNPNDEEDCIDGILVNDVRLTYPRIQVIGLNWAGEAFIGYRAEVALVIPEAVEFTQTNDEIQFLGGLVTTPAGEYEYELEDGAKPTTLSSQPYLKWTLGLDYTIGKHVYLNTQWVHGTFDEQGAGSVLGGGKLIRDGGVDTEPAATSACAFERDGRTCAWERWRPRIGDYAVIGMDINFLSNNALFRLFTIWDLSGVYEAHYDEATDERVTERFHPFTEEGFSAVLYPELAYNFGNGLELGTGVLVQLGQPYSKFGAAEAGGDLWWFRGRYYF